MICTGVHLKGMKYFLLILCLSLLPAALQASGGFSARHEKEEPKLVINLSFSVSNYNGFNVSCQGAADGSIDLTPTDGVAPYTFIWSNGNTSEDLTGLSAGTYTVTVTDLLGEVQTGSVTLTEPGPITITLDNSLPDSCGGIGDGTLEITTAGGVAGFSWQWSSGGISEDVSALISGTYTVTATDANGCTAVQTFPVSEVDAMSLLQVVTDVKCNGGTDGSIDITVISGNPLFTYLWSNGASTQDVSGLSAGTYTVTVTDDNNCVISAAYTVNQPAALSVVVDNVTSVLCNGQSTGAIAITASGGTFGYSYLWSNGSIQEDISGLTAGTYTVTVTDANLCTATASATINQLSALNLSTVVTNVNCNGLLNGAINLTVSGATPGYTYLWSTGNSSEDLVGLGAGTYTVTVTDANLCTASVSATVTQPPAISLSTVVTAVSCNSGNNGAVDLSVIGGTPGYSYLWNTGAVTQDITNLSAGTYTVTVTDLNSCTATTNATVTQPSALSLSTTVTNVACSGGSNGAVNLTVSGGSPGYSFQWSNGSTTEDINGVAAGTYTVTVTDINGCTASISATVSQSGSLNISFFPVNGTCNASNGSVTAIVSGGTPLYSYLWNTGATSPALTGLPAGTYTLTVTDAALCSITSSVSVGNTGSPLPSINQLTNVSCNGGSNGAIDINVSGGTLPYSYLWSNGAATQDITGLAAGTYTVTVTDANFCVGIQSFVVSEPLAVGGTAVVSNVLCNGGATGAISLTPSGGTPGYTFLWSNGSTAQNPFGLSAAAYTVTITDANGCTGVRTFTVSQPTVLGVTATATPSGCLLSTGTVSASPSGGAGSYSYLWSTGATSVSVSNLPAGTYTVTVTDANNCTSSAQATVSNTNGPSISGSLLTNVTCNGGTDGAIDISVTGGTPGYSYLWNTGATSQDLTGVAAGNYTVTVTDANNCSVSGSYLLTSPSAVSSSGIITNVLCNGDATGSINITPSGGNGNYSYLWNNGAVTQDISSIPAAVYTVTITDASGCTGTSVYTVNEPSAISSSFAVTDLTCNGVPNGSINLSVSGGTPGYSYLWSNGFTGQDPAGLSAGTFTVTITDLNGCSRIRTAVVSQPAAISAAVNTTPASCIVNNGTATVSASGGTGTLVYLWNTGQSSATISGLATGVYTVTVTDANNCTAISSGTVGQSTGPVISAAVVDSVTCNGGTDGSIDISITNGTPPITYLWSNGATTQDINGLIAGTYTVTVTDANSCTASGQYQVAQPVSIGAAFTQSPASCGLANGSLSVTISGGTPGYSYLWSTGGTNTSISNVIAGTYTVTVTDSRGCTAVFSSVVSGTAAPVIDSSVVVNVACNNGATGSITLFVSGGTIPLSFLWSNGAVSQNLSGLTNGNYSVTITDAGGCSVSRSFTVTQPLFLSATTATSPSFCGQSTGSATVTAGGGTPGYTYLWSNGATTVSISNLTAGTYSVTVTDANGCTRRRNAVVSLSNGPVISLASQTNVTCFGESTGALDITVTGGVLPYSYSWSNGASVQDISNLSAGTYTVFVTDSALCSDSASFTVVQPDSFVVSAVIQNAACGLSNGSIAVSVTGGNPTYTYLWSNGSTTNSVSNLQAGTYSLTVTDLSGCDSVFTFTVNALSGPAVVVDSIRNIRCFGVNNGRIFITASNGSSPYTYLWNDGNTGSDRFGLSAGTYTVTVTDAGGCTALVSATVTSNPQIQHNFTSTQASCGQANGTATVNPSGGVPSYSVIWETGATTLTISSLPAGVYSATITDSEGCVRVDSVAVTNTGSPAVNLLNQVLPTCFGGTNGSLTITISGGILPYSILWSTGATTAVASGLASGNYAVTVTDSAGCADIKNFSLSQPDSIQLQFSVSAAHCGLNDGIVTVSVLGGTGQMTYLWSDNSSSPVLSNASAGLYTLTVTDQNGCVNQDTVRVSDIDGPSLTVSSITPVSCFGGMTGAIDVSVFGGTAPLSYLWSSGQTTQDITGLSAGNYALVVTDSAGCTDTVPATVNQPSEIIIQSTVTDAACSNPNGSIQLSVTGGVSGYTYLWSNGATTSLIQNLPAGNYTVTVTDANNCTKQLVVAVNNLNGPSVVPVSMVPVTCPGGNNGQLNIDVQLGAPPFTFSWSNGATSQNLSGITAGIYTVTVTDFNNCVSIFSDTVTEPSAIVLSAVITNASCNVANGIIVLQSTGGTSGYTYLWSNGVSSSTVTGLGAGTYSVTATDAAGCTQDSVFSITNSGVPSITLDQIDSVSCFGLADGAINLSVTGGVVPYVFTWTNTPQTTEDINGLVAGSYSVIVTDDEGCTSSQLFTVAQPSEIQYTFPFIQDAACGQSNGTIFVQATGGIPGYTYQWSNGALNDTISALAAGSYQVTITDAKGCTKTGIANISNLNGPSITSVDSSGVTCYGGSDGFITITATGVSLPLSYSWSGLPFITPSITGLTAGSYTITVADNAGCLLVRTIVIQQPDSFTLNTVIPQNNPPYNISCNGLSDGVLNLSVIGANPPYSFVWSNGAITQNLLNIPASIYTVLVTDSKGCTTVRAFTLTEPPVLVANAGSDLIICGENAITLDADTPTIGIGFWQVVSSSGVVVFSDASSPVSQVSGMGEGENILQWVISDGICSDTDLVVITKASAIDAIAGSNRRICGPEVTLNATRPEFGYGYWTALNPLVTLDDSSKAFSTANGLSYGNNQFIWTVVNGTCRDSALVTIFRKDTLDCLDKIKLPTAFSPNFDGFNDFLVIKGLEDFPDNSIELYNRWGQLVYLKEGYINDWYGLDAEGIPLPDGTYFLIVKVRFINKVFNTYIDMRR